MNIQQSSWEGKRGGSQLRVWFSWLGFRRLGCRFRISVFWFRPFFDFWVRVFFILETRIPKPTLLRRASRAESTRGNGMFHAVCLSCSEIVFLPGKPRKKSLPRIWGFGLYRVRVGYESLGLRAFGLSGSRVLAAGVLNLPEPS